MKLRVALLALLAPLACSGQQTPCSGSTCLPIAGSYTFVLGQDVSCDAWASNVPPSSVMAVTQSGSQVTVVLWPISQQPHTLTGTLNANGSMTVSESTGSTLIGVPFATITGIFTSTSGQSGQPPFYFTGQLYLQGGNSAATGAAAGGGQTTSLTCNGSTSLQATEVAGSWSGGTTGGTGGGSGSGGSGSGGSGSGGSGSSGSGASGSSGGSTGGAGSSTGGSTSGGTTTGGGSSSGGTSSGGTT